MSSSRSRSRDEVPVLGDGHAGELGLVTDGRGERCVRGQPLEGAELAVGQHAQQVDDGRAVVGVVEGVVADRPARRRRARATRRSWRSVVRPARASRYTRGRTRERGRDPVRPVGALSRRSPASALEPLRHVHRIEAFPLTTFRDLGVLPETCAALEAVGITEPFAIQEQTLPVALAGNDVIGQAKTGTGKTLGFGIPLLQRVSGPQDADVRRPRRPRQAAGARRGPDP